MNRSATIWIILLIAGGGFLAFRAATVGPGRTYVRAEQVQPKKSDVTWTKYVEVNPSERNEPAVSLSWPRTIGIWIAGLLTLCILSFLYGDNPLYKLAEAVMVGASAAYAMVVGFWTGIVQNLFQPLAPGMMRDTVLPGINPEVEANYFYIVPLIFSIMMLMRLSPKGGWISRWPLAFFIGATAGIRLISYFDGDFVIQIKSTIIPLIVVTGGAFDWRASLKNTTIVLGVATSLVYFFFSIEHKGFVGGVARVGIWFLMITFGAGFGYTVMGRIALISERLKFLYDDWLWLIDPLGRRLGM